MQRHIVHGIPFKVGPLLPSFFDSTVRRPTRRDEEQFLDFQARIARTKRARDDRSTIMSPEPSVSSSPSCKESKKPADSSARKVRSKA